MDQVRYPTRRQILKTAIGGAAGLVLSPSLLRLTAAPRQAASEAAGNLKLADDLFVVTLPGEANVVAQIAADGVVLVDGYLYGFNDTILTCLEFATGNVMWRDGSVGKGNGENGAMHPLDR